MERKTEEDLVMRTLNMEKDRKTELKCYKKRHEGETSKDRRSTRPENVVDRRTWRLKARCADPKYGKG